MKKSLAFILAIFLHLAIARAANFQPVACEGAYPHHLQGACTNEKDSIYRSFTTKLVKTDRTGKVVKVVDIANHHGDLCFREGQIYVAVNLGKLNDPKGNADSWVYVYDASDLSPWRSTKRPKSSTARVASPFMKAGFSLWEGSPTSSTKTSRTNPTGIQLRETAHPRRWPHALGIQTAAFTDGHW